MNFKFLSYHFNKITYLFLFVYFNSFAVENSNNIISDVSIKAIDYGVDIDQHLIESVSLTPFVVAMEGETMTLEIKVTDPTISSIEMLDGFCQQFNSGIGNLDGLFLPNGATTITLYDDGTNGDKTSNDSIFTFNSIGFKKKRSANNPYYSNVVRKSTWETGSSAVNWHRGNEQEIKLTFDNGTNRITTIHVDHSCGGINLDYVPIPTINNIDSTARSAAHVLSITGLQKQSQFPHYYDEGPMYLHSEITNRVYEYVKDEYDWIIVQDVSSGRSQVYHPVSHRETGAYGSPYDFSAQYGSQAVLRGVLYDEIYWEPLVGINKQHGLGDYSTLNHEFAHTWTSFLPSSFDISSNDGHYDFIMRDTSCLNGNGGYTFSDIDYNSSTNVAYLNYSMYQPGSGFDNDICNDLELYLMGLIPKEQVQPIKTLVDAGNVEVLDGNPNFDFSVVATSVREITIDEIIQTIGDRVPSSVNSQKDFKALMVVVYDRLLTDNEMALFEYRMQDYEKNRSNNGKTFAHITNDLATINTKVELIDHGLIYSNSFEN